jgi:transporter family-2 protein
LSAVAGAVNPGQAAANAELNKALGQVLTATAFVYLSGLIGVALIRVFFWHPFPPSNKFAAVPWWGWTGGLLSLGTTIAGASYAQRLGSGVFTGISVTAAIIVSLVLDNFGWMGFQPHPATLPRILGGALMIAGLWLTARF